MSDLKRLIKVFEFKEVDRTSVVLSDPTKVRLNTESARGRAQLYGGVWDDQPYPTDTDIWVKTKLTTPNGIKKWLSFEAVKEVPVGTGVKFRFYNGTREIYFDGSGWVTATSTDWNTEVEIQNNFESFPFDNNTIGVIVNLYTTNHTVTPWVYDIRLLGSFEYEILEDVMNSLMTTLHDQITPVTDVVTTVSSTTDLFDLSDEYKLQNDGYNIVDVIRVYNKTDDLYEKNNLRDTYTLGNTQRDPRKFEPGILKTLVPIDAGKVIKMKVKYKPEVAEYTDEDFYEPSRLPLIAIEYIEEITRQDGLKTDITGIGTTLDGIIIKNLTNLTAVQVLPPAQIDLRIGYAVLTDSVRDQKRVIEAVERFLQTNSQLISLAFDEPYTLDTVQRLKVEAHGAPGNLRRATGSFDIRNINLFERPALDVPLVGTVNVEITN